MACSFRIQPRYALGSVRTNGLVLIMLWFSVISTLLQTARAGCDFGHGRHVSASLDSPSATNYARNFRVLGQWVYVGGQIKYEARQPESDCQGPSCKANEEPTEQSSGLSLPQQYRTNSTAVHFVVQGHWLLPDLCEILDYVDAKALHGYPPAYEYPP